MEWVEPLAFSVDIASLWKKKLFSCLIKSPIEEMTYNMIAIKSKLRYKNIYSSKNINQIRRRLNLLE